MSFTLTIVLLLASVCGVLCQPGTGGEAQDAPGTAGSDLGLGGADLGFTGADLGLNDGEPKDAVEFNKKILEPINKHFGNVGPIVYDFLTNENALGDTISQTSAAIRESVGAPQYKENLDTILAKADGIEFVKTLSPLFKKVEDLTDKDGNTLRDALDIIKNVFEDPNALNDLRNRMTAPSSAIPAA